MELHAPYELNRLVRLASTDDNPDSNEVIELSKAILRRSCLWTEPGFYHEFKDVLSPVSILAAEILASHRSSISREESATISSASLVILTYMVSNVNEENVRLFLNPMSALCTSSPTLDSKEKTEAVETLKAATAFPPGTLLFFSLF